jgi:putative thioredoxin
MGYSIDVYDHNFEEEVLEKSYEIPVIVDFYAVWCGPCQMLKPILEKVAQEYDCIVTKLNIDENQSIAQAFRVEGVPDVKIIRNGEIIDGFVGVLPEPQLRELLVKCNIKSQLDEKLDAIRQELLAGNRSKVAELFASLLTQYPEHRRVLIEAAKFYISEDKLEKAEELLSPIQMDEREFFAEAQAVKALIQFKAECVNPSGNGELESKFSRACCLTLDGEHESALQLFLEIVETDRQFKSDGARKAMLSIFELLGNDHPVTKEYRKRLMMVLY